MIRNEKKRLAIVGCGHLGNIVTDAYCQGLLPDYEMVGVLGRDEGHAQAMAAKAGCPVCHDLEELLAQKPDYIAEMASVQMVKDMAEEVLGHGANLVVLSIGAFADREFYERVQAVAREHGTKVHIASGAVGGFEVLRTISLMGEVKAEMAAYKGPKSLKNTPLFKEELMEKEAQVFEGNTKEAIAILPTKVNVAVAISLASAGPEDTKFKIFSLPSMVGDDYKIKAEVEGMKAELDIYSANSDIAGWSVVALLQNLASPIMF